MLLGKKVKYKDVYDKNLLFPVSREINRKTIITGSNLPFIGYDIWNAYEVSWINDNNMPQVRIATITYEANTPNIVESKSLKLYLNSLNNTNFGRDKEVVELISKDLSECVKGDVEVKLYELSSDNFNIIKEYEYISLDKLDIKLEPSQEITKNNLRSLEGYVEEKLVTNLLKSNCLVTGQPDWASLFIEYKGKKIDHQGLMRYIISFRNHQEFHEHCVERIFVDLKEKCELNELTVYARFTRRGGIDINPFRTNKTSYEIQNIRMIRQ